MIGAPTGVRRAVETIVPVDALEATHRAATLDWIDSGAPLYRIAKPAVPPQHLVAYFALVDTARSAVLLVDHRKARLWLPPGGHVEPFEDPGATVARELREELGISAPLLDGLSSNPLLVTQTATVNEDPPHLDVSLWYVLRADLDAEVHPDPGEFTGARWWTFDEVEAAAPDTLDPHLPRFVRKLRAELPLG